MSSQAAIDYGADEPVLIAAPTGRDATVLLNILGEAGVPAAVCTTADDLCWQIAHGAIAAVVADEFLTADARRMLAETVMRQPEWSDFPLIVMATMGSGPNRTAHWLREANGSAHTVVLERPVRRLTLLSTVKAAMQSRARQYQVRDELAERRQAEESLRASREQLRNLNQHLEQQVASRTSDLRTQNQRLRRLANQLSRVEELERRRFAEMLHDGLQQILVAGKMQLGLCRSGQTDALGRLEELLDTAIHTSRSLSHELSPPILGHFSLPAALEWLTRWFESNSNFGVHLQAKAEDVPSLDRETEIFLFNAVRELLLNAIKHSGSKAAAVAIRHDPGVIRIAVTDNGKGFDPDALETEENPHGFGLFNIRERLGALGGALEVNSTLGAGATFVLNVPIEELSEEGSPLETGAEVTAVEPNQGRQGPLRVLLVDDHTIVRKGIASLLRTEEGVELVGEASDGMEAVKLVDELKPDIVLMDVNMPRMDGIEATRRIKRAHPEVTIIGLSIHEADDQAETMCGAGASAYLCKGGQTEVLIRTIREVAQN